MSRKLIFLLLIFGVLVLFLINIRMGSVHIPLDQVLEVVTLQNNSDSPWAYILLHYRIPKAITAILVGMGLSLSGLMMQTLFRNPLAGPYVLGISSGASLGVAIVLLGANLMPLALAQYFQSSLAMVVAAVIGSILVMLSVFGVSRYLKDTMAILIVGLMFGSVTSAIVSVLSYFSSAEQLKNFTLWSMGNLGNQSWIGILTLSGICVTGLGIAFSCLKSLNGLLLGENYAKSLGINFNRTKNLLILSTCLLAGSITAFVGPIAFIGLAVPHITKLLFRTADHRILFWGTLLLGAAILLICDSVAQMPGFDFTLPINAVTSIIGAPLVIWLLIRRQGY